MTEDDRAARYLPLLDTRFTPEWLATHESDRQLAEFVTGSAGAKSAEVLRGEAEQLDARRRHDVLDRLDRITCPTLVAGGRFDGIAPLANSEAIAARIPDSELRIYEGGHAFFAQDRDALTDVLDFLTA